jgi:hypothetical protein
MKSNFDINNGRRSERCTLLSSLEVEAVASWLLMEEGAVDPSFQ